MQFTEIGNHYSYLAYKRDTQFFIGFTVGKWNDETCDIFYKMLASRLRFPTRKRKLTIFTDGNKQNITAIAKNFHTDSVRYGLRKKIRINQKIVGIVSKTIFGNPGLDKIGITQIDGFCSKLRERISCFTRKARSFAKRKIGLEDRLEIFSVQHNFMEKKHGKTPAMKEKITSKIWNWTTILHTRLTTLN
ncbi:hypothetical protein J4457_02025 [Candidatus Woesearchaeota archaeon]|nr:hypothetical protein [Candidatus Woesearchaeota archaeon]